MEWQPIETAPKDGNKVILYAKSGEMFFALFAERGEWMHSWNGELYEQIDPLFTLHLTHWMPLPKPPQD